MKYISVKFGWSNHYLVPCNTESAELLVALGQAIKVTEKREKDTVIYQQDADQSIELGFVDNPRFGERTTVEQELLTKLQAAESRWLEYYTKANEAEKRAKLAEEKLAQVNTAVTEAVK